MVSSNNILILLLLILPVNIVNAQSHHEELISVLDGISNFELNLNIDSVLKKDVYEKFRLTQIESSNHIDSIFLHNIICNSVNQCDEKYYSRIGYFLYRKKSLSDSCIAFIHFESNRVKRRSEIFLTILNFRGLHVEKTRLLLYEDLRNKSFMNTYINSDFSIHTYRAENVDYIVPFKEPDIQEKSRIKGIWEVFIINTLGGIERVKHIEGYKYAAFHDEIQNLKKCQFSGFD